MAARMAQYHGFSEKDRPIDVASRIERGLEWCVWHWRQLAAVLVVLLLAAAGGLWYQHQQDEQAHTASTLAFQAHHDPTQLESLATQYRNTVAGQEARFTLASRAIDAHEYAKAREWLEPMSQQASLPLLQAAAIMWIATTFETENQWDDAAQWYRRVLAMKAAGLDHDRALRNLVRALKHTGKTDEVSALLRDTPLRVTKETEELWLAIDHAYPPSQP